ncbi:MAG: hypothetical protein RLZZ28_1842 [Bacteroidota bacterium]|jgi:hypothetical protein
MKALLFFVGIALASSSFGQEFLGIKVDGKMDSVIVKFKAKGFTLRLTESKKDSAILEGMAGNSHVEVYISASPVTYKVWKLSVFLPKENTWNALKASYDKYLGILKDKYGEPNKSFDFFISPFKKGDGNEMQAVSQEKCVVSSYWSKVALMVEISSFNQVRITYENMTNSALANEERKEINNKIF